MKTEEEIREQIKNIEKDDLNISNTNMPDNITADYLMQNRIYKNALKWVLEDED